MAADKKLQEYLLKGRRVLSNDHTISNLISICRRCLCPASKFERVLFAGFFFTQLLLDLLHFLHRILGAHVPALFQHFQPEYGKQEGAYVECVHLEDDTKGVSTHSQRVYILDYNLRNDFESESPEECAHNVHDPESRHSPC